MKPLFKTSPKLKPILVGLIATAFILPVTGFAMQDNVKVKQNRFELADTNGDGSVDMSEFMAQAGKMADQRGDKVKRGGRGRQGGMRGHVKPADLNGDGQISLEEFSKPSVEALVAKANKHLKSRFDDLDRNEDGQLSKAEQERPLRKRFERMDANGDGKLSKKEMWKSMKHSRGGKNGGKHQKVKGRK